MARKRSPRPPKRRCPGCGGDVYAWAEGTPCAGCIADHGGDRSLVAGELERRRAKRRSERQDSPPATYNELPPGF